MCVKKKKRSPKPSNNASVSHFCKYFLSYLEKIQKYKNIFNFRGRNIPENTKTLKNEKIQKHQKNKNLRNWIQQTVGNDSALAVFPDSLLKRKRKTISRRVLRK